MNRLTGKRVLLVEDEFLIAELTAGVLEDLSMEVVGPAYRLADGLRLAEKESLDLAVLDVNLGEGRSDPIAQVLQARKIPFVFVTGYAGLSAAPLIGPALDKPLDAAKLRLALETALDHDH